MAKKVSQASGKRKTAVARATVQAGKGEVTVNGTSLEHFSFANLYKSRVMEPILLLGDDVKGLDIRARVRGSGPASQADALRLAISRAIVGFLKKEKIRESLLQYDRTLLVADVRRKEMCKPNISKARKNRQKSYR